ncbi:MAG: hypothetical protein ACOC13_01725 [Tangfeifania sp.]
MYVQRNKTTGKNGKPYTSTLLCTKYRQDGKIKTKVKANFLHMPEALVLTNENMLKHGKGALVSAESIAAFEHSGYQVGCFYTDASRLQFDADFTFQNTCDVRAAY